MVKFLHFKTMALLLLMIVGASSAWAVLPNNPKWVATALSDISDNATVIIISNSEAATNIALPSTTTSSNPAKKACTVSTSDGVTDITAPNGSTLQELAWTIKKVTSNGSTSYKFYQEGSSTVRLYLSGTSSNTALRVGDTTSDNDQFVLGDANKLLKVTTAARYVGPYDNNGTDWRTYNSESATNYKGAKLTFYVLQSATSSPLSFISLSGTYPTSFNEGDEFSHEGMTVTATYEDNSTLDVTSSAIFTGYNMTTTGSQTVTVSYTEGEVTKTTTYNITVNAVPSHSVTWSVNGEPSTESYKEGATINFPTNPSEVNGNAFVGWTTAAIDGTTNTAPEFVTFATMGNADITFYAVFATVAGEESINSLEILSTTDGVPTSYGTANTFTEYTLGGLKFKIMQMYKSGGKLQWRAGGNSSGTGTMYNSESLGKIQSIVLTYNSSDNYKNFTLKVGNTENPTNGVEITPSSNNNVYTFDCSAQNAAYFVLANGANAGYLDKIVINYTISSYTYSNYCTTVSSLPRPEIVLSEDAITMTWGDTNKKVEALATINNVDYEGDFVFTSSNSNLTVDNEGNITCDVPGNYTVTVSIEATSTYQAASKTCAITVNKKEAGISYGETSSYNVFTNEINSFSAPTLINGNNLDVEYSSDNTTVATITDAGGVTLTGAEGTAAISATFAGNDLYNAGSASYTITVNDPNKATFTFSEDYGQTFINNNTYATSEFEYTGKAVSLYVEGRYRFWDNDKTLRLYKADATDATTANAQMMLTAPAGNVITSVDFGVTATALVPDYGSISGSTWTGAANSVLFTHNGTSGSVNIATMTVHFATSFTQEVSSNGWATFIVPDVPVTFAEGDAYVVSSVNATSATLSGVTSVPAHTPVLLKGAGTKTINVTTTTPSAPTNLLTISDGTAPASGSYNWVLAKDGEGACFKQWTGDADALTGKVVLVLNFAAPSTNARLQFVFDDEATGVNAVNGEGVMVNGSVFDLQGRRVAQPQKGLYIVNGRKVVVK